MFRLFNIFPLLLVDNVYGGSIVCNPHFNCETCTNRYSCYTCAIGTFMKRAGGYYECATCDAGCVSCHYYNDCHECVKGRYGKGCELQCSTGCFDGRCGQLTGNCTCKENFVGNACDKCTQGRYGTNCHLKCSGDCLDGTGLP